MKAVCKKASALLLSLILILSMSVVPASAKENDQKGAALGIISAMDVELAALLEAADVEKTETVAGNTFHIGTLNGVDVVLVRGGVGKVLAASCAETMIDVFDVGAIVFTGIAGGVGDNVNVMDMVIANNLVQHDYGKETNEGLEWNGKAAADKKTGLIPVDKDLSKIAYDAACSVLGKDKVHEGVIATGDQFVASETYVKELQTKFDALACEMEGASVARIADQYGVPCAVIRCMSDKADGIAHDTYEFNYVEASNTSAEVVQEMTRTISKAGTKYTAAQVSGEADKTPRTAVISAMDAELASLVEAAEIEKEVVVGGNTFHVGKLNGENVVLVRAGVGKVLAASCTAALLNNFNVKGIVFTGIAGGVGDNVNVMDMVIANNLVQHDYGRETNDGFVWNGKAAADKKTGLIPVDKELSKIAYAAACNTLGAKKVHQGVIATGDQFVASEKRVKELQDQFNALACEMEGASVARIADQYGVPCAVIRCMSDKADGIAHDTYEFNYTESCNTSASVVKEMLKIISSDLPFEDVAKTSWYYSYVNDVYENGLMSGTSNTTFAPQDTMTRGQVAVVLHRLEGKPTVPADEGTAFSDVTANSNGWCIDAADWAAHEGIMKGYDDGSFGAAAPITREQLAAVLYRYAQTKDQGFEGNWMFRLDFEDAASVSEYAYEAMCWCTMKGIVTGADGKLSPKDTATRAQVAAMLLRFQNALAEK